LLILIHVAENQDTGRCTSGHQNGEIKTNWWMLPLGSNNVKWACVLHLSSSLSGLETTWGTTKNVKVATVNTVAVS